MAEAKKSRVKSVLGGKKKKSSSKKGSKKHVHKMHISRTDNNKFMVEHEFAPSEGPEPSPQSEMHAVEPEDLAQHVTDHMGVGGEGGAPAGPAPMPTAPPGGGSPMPGV